MWREKVDRNAIAGLDTYELSPKSNDAQVVWITNLEVDEKHYTPLGGETIAAAALYNSYQVGPDYTTVKITPTPGADKPKALKFVLMLAPCNGSLDLPDEIIDQYFETIRDGVLERMMAHGNRPYTNLPQSEIHKRKFHAAITRIRRDVRGGNSNSSPPWRFPITARGGVRRGARSYGY